MINLSLLDCREAKQAVITGLSDPEASVRRAAAMNAGLYGDGDVLNALERYFESHRLELTVSLIGEGLDRLKSGNDDSDDEDASGHPIAAARLAWAGRPG